MGQKHYDARKMKCCQVKQKSYQIHVEIQRVQKNWKGQKENSFFCKKSHCGSMLGSPDISTTRISEAEKHMNLNRWEITEGEMLSGIAEIVVLVFCS